MSEPPASPPAEPPAAAVLARAGAPALDPIVPVDRARGARPAGRRSRLLPWLGSALLFAALAALAYRLAEWKRAENAAGAAAAAALPEPVESITAAEARPREHRRTSTTIGTVLALRSVTLRNELQGTVHTVALTPGAVVEEGTVLVVLDVTVEEAELKAEEAELSLAEAQLGRMQRASESKAVPAMEVDRARAERDVARARIERTRAIIARKTIRAPFRARIGLSDVHVGQYLLEGTELTTLQGVDAAVHVDFAVPQQIAAGLAEGDTVEVFSGRESAARPARVVAVDARVDSATRNAWVRARIEVAAGAESLAPGASVRVRVPVGEPLAAVTVPVNALRRGPDGDHVFLIADDPMGISRAHLRRVDGGAMLGDEVLILSGLAAGDRVAASGAFKLREGVRVAIATEVR